MPIRANKIQRLRKRKVLRRKSAPRRSGRLMLKTQAKPTIRSMGRGVPDRLMVKLRYCDIMQWSVAQSVVGNPLVMGTSLYAPRQSGGGHQCLWYDQWTPNIYTKYRVYGIKYHVRVQNRSYNESFYVAVRPQNTAVAETNMQTLIERNDSKVRMGSSVNGGQSTVTIKGFMGTAKTLGIPKSEVKNEEWFTADYNTNPIKQALLYFYLSHNYAGTASFDVTVRCTYYAELFNKAVPPAS